MKQACFFLGRSGQSFWCWWTVQLSVKKGMMIWLHSFWGKMWQNHLARKLVSCSRLLFWSHDQKSLWHFMNWVTDLFRARGQTVFWSTLPGVSLRAHLQANWLAVRIIFPTWFDHLADSFSFFLFFSFFSSNNFARLWKPVPLLL